jgi:hypothetical protein
MGHAVEEIKPYSKASQGPLNTRNDYELSLSLP